MLGVGAVVVLYEDDLQFVVDRRVVIDEVCNAVDIADDGLGTDIAGRGLCAEDKCRRRKVGQAPSLRRR